MVEMVGLSVALLVSVAGSQDGEEKRLERGDSDFHWDGIGAKEHTDCKESGIMVGFIHITDLGIASRHLTLPRRHK